MHMFSRVSTLTGGAQRPMAWALSITERVNAIMDLDVTLWSAAFGYPGGTVAWSTLVESRAQLAAEMGKTQADQGFVDLVEAGQEFQTGPFNDSLRSMVHMTSEPDGTPPPLGAVADMVTAAAAGGKAAAAMAWGVEIADKFAAVTGTAAAFLSDDYGPNGQVTWFAIHQDAAAADAAAAKVAADAGYVAAVDEAGDLFVPGSGARGSLVRIG